MRYAAFLRGVSPLNAKMPELKRAFERAGFEQVKTVLSSGNVVFSAPRHTESELARRAEAAMNACLGSSFFTIVRSVTRLQELLDANPFADFRLAPSSKRVVTFLPQKPKQDLDLPISFGGARILCTREREVFTAYVQSDKGPVFMSLLERTFGKNITTRTWETVGKVAK